jgi:hypothetical protein
LTENYVIIVFEHKVLRNSDFCLIKSVIVLSFYIFLRNMKKKLRKSCKIFQKWLSCSVGTKQHQTERLSQKPEPNHNQMF